MQRTTSRLGNTLIIIMLIIIVAVMILQYIPTNYVVYLPGPAAEVGPMVQTEARGEDGDEDEGQFLLTAVYQNYPNLFRFLQLQFDPYAEFHKREEIFAEGEDEDQYVGRQQVSMLGSQSNAILAVYETLGIPYQYKDQGLFVQSVMEGYPVAEVLQPWDRIDEAAGQKLTSFEDLQSALEPMQAGDVIELVYMRAGGQYTAEVELRQLPPAEPDGEEDAPAAEPAVGLGVGLLVMRTVEAEDERYRVTISAEDIGGPSAGLMFALEIYNRFVPEDISKGYMIAGTGEISPHGEVGIIGGIRHKVIGADQEGADIFLAPADYVDAERGITYPNYSEAVKTAEEIGSQMQIVEASNLSDVLEYLEQLPPKSGTADIAGTAEHAEREQARAA